MQKNRYAVRTFPNFLQFCDSSVYSGDVIDVGMYENERGSLNFHSHIPVFF
jgi:hypothetical protein